METVTARSRNALLIIDVQVSLVELIPAEIQGSVLPRMAHWSRKHALPGRPSSTFSMMAPRGTCWSPVQGAGTFIPRSIHPPTSPSSENGNRTPFLKPCCKKELKKRGITHLIIAGGITEYGIDTTCRRATSLDYDVTLARDAHLTRDNGVLTAANIIAHHNSVLDDFGAGDHLITVKPLGQIVF